MTDAPVTSQEARKKLYEAIRRDIPFEEKARAALELGVAYLEADNGHLARIDTETGHWEALVSTESGKDLIPPGLELDTATTYCRRTLESDSQIAVYDAPDQGWEADPAYTTHGFNCYLGTTLVVEGESFGTICFVAEDPREEPFSDSEKMFAELIARLLEREIEHDRTEAALTRQANLSTVLSRVLRHNLRNDMSVIRGLTQHMADQLDNDRYAEIALDNIDGLIELSEKARTLDRIVATPFEREPADVVAVVTEVAERVSGRYRNGTVSVESDKEITASVFPSFERAVEELIDNALKHSGSDPTVVVSVDIVPNAFTLQIADDGPGLSNTEAKVLESGAETPLAHGTGLGLWLAHWIVSSHDGSIEATVSEDGTTMTVSIPRKSTGNLEQRLSKLTQARDQYKAAFEDANDAIVMLNDDARIVDGNPEAARMSGLCRERLLGQPIRDFLPEEFDFEATWTQFRDTGTERGTVTVTDATGAEHTIEYSAKADIVPGQHLVICRDVTERIEREAELSVKTEAMEQAPVGITLADPNQEDNPMVYTNQKFCELSGYDEAEILGRNCRFMQGPETDAASVAKIRAAIDAAEPVTETLRNYRKDGTQFWNRLTIAPVEDSDGQVTNWVGFQEDVTERIEREAELSDATDRLEAIIEVSPDPIVAVDADGRIELWNEAAEEVFGYAAEAVLGEEIQSVGIHRDGQQSAFEAQVARALAGEKISGYEIQRRKSDGDPIQLRLYTAPLRGESGTVTGVMAVARESTDYTDSEQTG
ncbi:PAS domain S-box protein [Haloarcula salinisoli]|uniref:PAS domain S-box protein n=1 Tax=Haloarcula salinisoli TaxID=2487746 RepID=A0A8J8C704_9EURY|nr:PAS domain S-box protein [Halomicroarcula salinisoli]MBX0302787.1 PAS domain S-box protein [Halomicroarcula salinisoli]